MKKLHIIILLASLTISACQESGQPIQEENLGYKMVLTGNSFFKPYAEQLDEVAHEAGFIDHQATIVTRGGENGTAISLWNNTGESNRRIKEALDQGDVDYFGMTAGYLADDPTDGFSQWISYALESNPEIKIFLSIPPIDFPMEWEKRSLEYGFDNIHDFYDYFVNELVHQNLIEELRKDYPSIKIFSIPTGLASINLWQKREDGQLEDELELIGPWDSSLFTDEKGHQGKMISYTGTFMWLNAIYRADLSKNTFDTGFKTNLQEVAGEIMTNHDPLYKQ
jgi:hypothetical protein